MENRTCDVISHFTVHSFILINNGVDSCLLIASSIIKELYFKHNCITNYLAFVTDILRIVTSKIRRKVKGDLESINISP